MYIGAYAINALCISVDITLKVSYSDPKGHIEDSIKPVDKPAV